MSMLPALLAKQYNWGPDIGVLTTAELLAKHPPIEKKTYVQEYSEHRVHLEYVKLNPPKIHYELVFNIEGRRHMFDFPKIIWDSIE